MLFLVLKGLKDTDFTYCKKCRERCVVFITLLHTRLLPVMAFIFHSTRDTTQWDLFMTSANHATAAENIAVYNSHLQDLMQCRLLTKCTAWAVVLGAVRVCCIER